MQNIYKNSVLFKNVCNLLNYYRLWIIRGNISLSTSQVKHTYHGIRDLFPYWSKKLSINFFLSHLCRLLPHPHWPWLPAPCSRSLPGALLLPWQPGLVEVVMAGAPSCRVLARISYQRQIKKKNVIRRNVHWSHKQDSWQWISIRAAGKTHLYVLLCVSSSHFLSLKLVRRLILYSR